MLMELQAEEEVLISDNYSYLPATVKSTGY